jgi:RNA polymerase sigma-70 factor (ECF subfamily)
MHLLRFRCVRGPTSGQPFAEAMNDLGRISPDSPAQQSITTTLLGGVRAKDGDAWRRLTYLYEPVVRGWCRQQHVPDADASDVVQEVFQAVMRGIEGFRRERPDDTFRGWLFGITRHKVLDYWRAKENRPDTPGGSVWAGFCRDIPDADDSSAALSTQAASPTIHGLFRRALELIRADFEERTFQAFWRVAVEDCPTAEVASALGMSSGAVYVAKSRVLKRLREELEGLERLEE